MKNVDKYLNLEMSNGRKRRKEGRMVMQWKKTEVDLGGREGEVATRREGGGKVEGECRSP